MDCKNRKREQRRKLKENKEKYELHLALERERDWKRRNAKKIMMDKEALEEKRKHDRERKRKSRQRKRDESQIESEPRSKTPKVNNFNDELDRFTTQSLKAPSSPVNQIAILWSDKLSKMDRNQRIIAEKVINEVMFNGELGLLTFNTTLANINSDCNIKPSSSDKNIAISACKSLVETPASNSYTRKFNRTGNDCIQQKFPTVNIKSEVITDYESGQNEPNFIVSDFDPHISVKEEE